MDEHAPLNKTMDRADLNGDEAKAIAAELDQVVRDVRARGLTISSWYGGLGLPRKLQRFQALNRGVGYEPLQGSVDDENFPWFLYWEIVWLVLNVDFAPGQRVLDMGGSSSLFSFFLAARGLEVTTVDLAPELVANADEVARGMDWQMTNLVMDMRTLDVPGPFDHITSVCVFEHLPVSHRPEVSSRIRRLLKPGGSFAITFDYANPSRAASIGSPRAVDEQFVQPSGLTVRGSREFHDNGKRYLLQPFYHPRAFPRWKLGPIVRREFPASELFKRKRENDYTFGALFMTH